MSTVNTSGPETVLDLLHRENAVFHRLENLAARQRELVAGADMSPLLELLDRRKALSAELTAIERELAPVRRNWQGVRTSLAPKERELADGLIDDAGGRLRRLMEGDEEDARKLSIRKQAVTQTLRAAGRTHNALSAYRGGAERPTRLDCTDATA